MNAIREALNGGGSRAKKALVKAAVIISAVDAASNEVALSNIHDRV